MLDIEEDILFQKHFGSMYEPLRQWENTYQMEIMAVLYYEPISKTCLDLLAIILDECINWKTIYKQKRWLHKTGKINRDYRYNKLQKSGYITIEDGYIIPAVNKEHLQKCYYEDKIKEKENEQWV